MARYGEMLVRKHKTSNRWQGYMYYTDADGNRKQVTKLAKAKLKRDAIEELREWERELKEQAKAMGAIDPKKHKDSPTVEEMITKYLQYQYERREIEESTYKMQMYYAKAKIFPYIGDYLFVDLDMVAIELWLTKLHQEEMKENTIHAIYAIANKTYYHYYHVGLIPNNPFEYVKTPNKSAARITHLDDEGMTKLLNAIDAEYPIGGEMRTVCFLALYAGLRRGEICGLRWRDVDLNLGTIDISTSIAIGYGKNYPKDPKNKSSRRSFPLLEVLQDALQERYEKVQRDYGTVDSSWFVVGDTIHYMPPTNLSRDFHKFVVKYDIRDAYDRYITPHALRHNYASVGIRSHMDIASLSIMMGHASRAMTLDTYGDASADALIVASEKLNERFRLEREGDYLSTEAD